MAADVVFPPARPRPGHATVGVKRATRRRTPRFAILLAAFVLAVAGVLATLVVPRGSADLPGAVAVIAALLVTSLVGGGSR